jgi:hypothetical protein
MEKISDQIITINREELERIINDLIEKKFKSMINQMRLAGRN